MWQLERRTRQIAVGVAIFALAGCTALPRAGPDDTAIESNASLVVKAAGDDAPFDYVLVNLTEAVVRNFSAPAPGSLRDGFGGGHGPAPEIPLGVGDIIEITLFESTAGGLFIPREAGSRPGNFVTLPRQTVDHSGMISVPYAGRLRAAGKTARQVEREIVNALANRAIEPQAVINVIQSRSNQVAVLGDVNSPSRLEINPAGERLLDVISRAGGISTPSIETYITVQRGQVTATASFNTLINQPRENIFVYPGDTVFANRERRTYLAFGASGLNGRIDFEESGLTLAEAVGKAGGLLDSRADPAQVFLFRTVDQRTLAKLGAYIDGPPGTEIPVVFRANFRSPEIFFLAQKFAMADKDVLYVSNSDSVELIKFLNLVNSVSDTSASLPVNALVTRDAVKELVK